MPTQPRLTWQELTLKLANPFRVSYGVSTTRTAHWLRLQNDEGWGEGTIPPYYGVEAASMAQFWDEAAQRADPFPEDVGAITDWIGDAGPAPARCALDLALHDRLGRRQGLPLYRLLGLPQSRPLHTAITIGIDEPDVMARQAERLAAFPILKLKLGSGAGDSIGDDARLAAVRQARPDARLFVDANAAWDPHEAVQRIQALLPYDLEMVEQPVPRADIEGMGQVQAQLEVPVVADESVQSLADVQALARAGVQAINVKLQKLGGLAPALEVIRTARDAGMRIMLGCMIETSLGVTAVAHLAGLADWLDLDAPLLVANDPFRGITYDRSARISVSDRPGLGVQLTEEQ